LCDAESIIHKSKNKAKFQIGVCSGVVILEKKFPNKIIINQRQKDEFAIIKSLVLSSAHKKIVYPSSPEELAFYLDIDNKDIPKIKDSITDPKFINNKLKRISAEFFSQNHNAYLTNTKMKHYKGSYSFELLKEYLRSLESIDSLDNIDIDQRNKIFTLELSVLRKSIISGTKSLHRCEFSNALHSLGEYESNNSLFKAAELFNQSGILWRNLSRNIFHSKKVNDKPEFISELSSMIDKIQEIEIEGFNYLSGL